MNRYRNSTFLLIIAGFALLVLGLFLIIFPFADYSSNMSLMSLAMIVIGFFYIIAFALNKKWHFRPGWTLSQGFYLVIIGILCLYSYDRELSDNMNFLFAMWALASGTSQIAASVQLRSLEFINWWRMLLSGIVNILFFAYFIMDPLSDYISLYTSFGVYILASGIICLCEPFVYRATME